MIAGVVRLEHLEAIAYTFKMAYDMGVQDVQLRSISTGDGDHGPTLDQWDGGMAHAASNGQVLPQNATHKV